MRTTSFRKGSKRELKRNHQSNLSYQHIKVSTANLQLPGRMMSQFKTNFMSSYDHLDMPSGVFSPSNASDLNQKPTIAAQLKSIQKPADGPRSERSPDANRQLMLKRNDLSHQI
jgi:hypothetical protein